MDGQYTDQSPQSVAVQPEEQCDMMSHSERVTLARTFLGDELPATDSLVPRTVPRLSALAQADYNVPVAPQPGFPFSEAMINRFQKIQQELQTTPGVKSHRFASVPRSRVAMYSPLELPATGFRLSQDSPVEDMGFTEISLSRGSTTLGTEQKYIRDLAAMTRRRLCISSFQDWMGAALNRAIQGLIDHVNIGSVSREQLLEQLKVTLQLSQSVATGWSNGATLNCAIAYNATRTLSPCVTRGTGAPAHGSIWGIVNIRRARN